MSDTQEQQQQQQAEPFWSAPKYTACPVDTQIAADHAHIRNVHAQYKSASESGNQDLKLRYINEFIRCVAVHAVAEEIVVYPAIEARLVRGRDTRQHALDEHATVKKLLHAVDRMPMGGRGDTKENAQFEATVDRCMEELEHHMAEEEELVLPQLRRNCWETELVQLNNQYIILFFIMQFWLCIDSRNLEIAGTSR